MHDALNDAKSLCGGASELAKRLSDAEPHNPITPQAVSQWTRVPAARAIAVERLTGISRHDLRPDIFGPAPHREAAE